MDQLDELQEGRPVPDGPPEEEPAAAGPAVVYDTPPEAVVPAGEPARLDLNTATAAQLSSLPGITATMAARIVDYRAKNGPFKEPAEITRVRGVSRAHYERIAGQVTVGGPAPAADEPAAPAVVPEPEVELPPPPPEPEPAAAAPASEPAAVAPASEPAPAPQRPRPAPPPLVLEELEPRSGPSWPGVLVIGLVSALLGAALAIAILALLNGTLQFGRAAALRDVSTDVQQIDGQVQQLSGELSAMQAQLEQGLADLGAIDQQLETVQGQLDLLTRDLSAVRTEFRGLRADVDAMGGDVRDLQGQADRLETQLGRIGEEVRAMRASVDRFDAFLEGLRALLGEGEPGEGTAPLTPAATPGTRSPRLTPTPTP